MKLKSFPPAAKYAVVLNPGTLFEELDSFTATLRDAIELAAEFRIDGIPADAMRIEHDGTLTTEF